MQEMALIVRRTFLALYLASICSAFGMAQIPAGLPGSKPATQPPEASDPLKRTTPREAVYSFLEACRSRNYIRASQYLDLSKIPARDRRTQATVLALQLEEILDHDSDFDVARLNNNPEGNQRDSLAPDEERIDSFQVDDRTIDIELHQIDIGQGVKAWVFSSKTVEAIPTLHALIGESPIEKHLPSYLVTTKFIETSLWQWIALLLLIPLIGLLARLLSTIALLILRPLLKRKSKTIDVRLLKPLTGPIGLLLGVVAYNAGVQYIGPSALVRLYITHLLTLFFFIAVAWLIVRVLDLVASRFNFSSDPRQRALFYSVLPLGLRLAKIILFVVAVVATLSMWGYNTSTIWATLGVGSLAVALAAQKTLENFFGGVSVIGDRPVLVGDFCKVGDKTGTVEDIGLRSTRIRTLDRTVVTVPNSQFSTMTLENFAPRDKMLFHPTISLRYDTTPAQVRQVLASFDKILRDHPKVEVGSIPVRFINIGSYSYDIEIFAYVLTADGDEFVRIQQELLLSIMDAVEAAGTALAVPAREIAGTARIKTEAFSGDSNAPVGSRA
jgi:MscS family membrane protein